MYIIQRAKILENTEILDITKKYIFKMMQIQIYYISQVHVSFKSAINLFYLNRLIPSIMHNLGKKWS